MIGRMGQQDFEIKMRQMRESVPLGPSTGQWNSMARSANGQGRSAKPFLAVKFHPVPSALLQ